MVLTPFREKVSVAKNFDAPIKILWPKNLIDVLQHLAGGGAIAAQPKWAFTMLGLGDIVIPGKLPRTSFSFSRVLLELIAHPASQFSGIFISLALRFDQNQAASKKPSTTFTRFKTSFPKPYFHATVFAYVAGLATTMAVMHIFRAAQPALLYLSPACSAAVAITALVRGEWSAMWGWSDEEEEEDGKKDGTQTADSSIAIGEIDAGASSDATIRAADGPATPDGKSTKSKKKKSKSAAAAAVDTVLEASSSAVENGSPAARTRGKGKKQ